jgi:hypothetical protein
VPSEPTKNKVGKRRNEEGGSNQERCYMHNLSQGKAGRFQLLKSRYSHG